MARTSDERNKIIRLLADNPNIEHACKSVGIARATHYRWMESNVDYRRGVNRALKDGRERWIEVAEAALMKGVKDGKLRAIQFFLTHNDPRYMPKRSRFVEPLTEIERRDYERLKVQIDKSKLPPHIHDTIMKAFENYGIVRKDRKK